MRATRHVRIVVCSSVAFLLTSCGASDDATSLDTVDAPVSPSPYVYVWAGDVDAAEGDTDFLAVVDADPDSPTYGSVLSTAPVGSAGNDPHHSEMVAPSVGLLFANGFKGNRTFLFDLSSPAEPALAGELDPVPGYAYPHSFYRLANGHVIATLQRGTTEGQGETGGLAEFDANGGLLRVTSAADPNVKGDTIRPYSAEIFPEIDRVLTTNMSMTLERTDNVLHLWRLSDLSLLATLELPPLPSAEGPECSLELIFMEGDCSPARVAGHDRPFEIRALPDGSALLNTIACGFYRIHGMDTDKPQVDVVMNWPETVGCAVPTIVGKFEVLPNMVTNEIVTLDVSDPTNPVEVARMTMDTEFMPHWAQVDPGTNRVAVSGIGPEAGSVLMYWVDPDTGELSHDAAFGQAAGLGPGLVMSRDEWPHGPTGAAAPHAVLFGR
jgi:hypothetical protein